MPHDQYLPPRQPGASRPGTRQPRKARPRTTRGPLLWTLAAVSVLVGLFLFGAAAQNFGRNSDPAAATAAAGKPKATTPAKGTGATGAKPPGFGDPVRDGRFEFVVSRADCSKSNLGMEHLKRTAKGKYCVVDLSVKNIADNPQLFLGSAQEAFDAAGTKFSDDEIAGLYANVNTQTFLRIIGPGEKVVGKVVFDVPKSTTLTTVELHDSFFSGGAQVALR
jgi:hypothetical protein